LKEDEKRKELLRKKQRKNPQNNPITKLDTENQDKTRKE
jgi:hypothetical protein